MYIAILFIILIVDREYNSEYKYIYTIATTFQRCSLIPEFSGTLKVSELLKSNVKSGPKVHIDYLFEVDDIALQCLFVS